MNTATLPQGGHAPGHLRDAFCEAVQAFHDWRDGPEPTVTLDDAEVPISAVCGLLWNCSDTLPNHEFTALEDCDIRAGSYAGAARAMKAAIEKANLRAEALDAGKAVVEMGRGALQRGDGRGRDTPRRDRGRSA